MWLIVGVAVAVVSVIAAAVVAVRTVARRQARADRIAAQWQADQIASMPPLIDPSRPLLPDRPRRETQTGGVSYSSGETDIIVSHGGDSGGSGGSFF
ncbi:hypothetical protein AB0M43_22640 [Longispora sp. NPDC051575]|uniref:hypothetical protein n=1 Tax=Longispora sp. NPDC051575 TaxID=3154943 RepID=UPI003416C1CD